MNPFRRPRPQAGWTEGNRLELLENGEAYYPGVFAAVDAARHEVLIETFILFEDKVGLELRDRLVAAARRGVSVDLTVDGYGSPGLSDAFIASLTDAGVRLHVYDPQPRLWRVNPFRRLHRKIVVVDGALAFIGGINFSHDHLKEFGPEAKLDHAVRLRGPLTAQIRAFVHEQLPPSAARAPRLPVPPPSGDARAMLVVRDNHRHRTDIERQYRAAIRSARREVIVANAYFFPGYRLLKAMRRAARRGVQVRLILQGRPDMPLVKRLTDLLYSQLVGAGVRIYEYCERPMHSKVALVDDEWATVGSSNLDPLSLAFNLEANLVIRHRPFNDELRARLLGLIANHCRTIEPGSVARRTRWRVLLDTLAYHFTRHFPSWAGWLPAHTPKLTTVASAAQAAQAPQAAHWDERSEQEPFGRTR